MVKQFNKREAHDNLLVVRVAVMPAGAQQSVGVPMSALTVACAVAEDMQQVLHTMGGPAAPRLAVARAEWLDPVLQRRRRAPRGAMLRMVLELPPGADAGRCRLYVGAACACVTTVHLQAIMPQSREEEKRGTKHSRGEDAVMLAHTVSARLEQ